jgi:hypothetical protein
MLRAVYIFSLLMLMASSLPAFAGAQPDDLNARLRSQLDAEGLMYTDTDAGGLALAFESDNAGRVDIQVDFSEYFTHISSPIGFIPDPAGEDYLFNIIAVTGSVAMVKPIIDEDRFFYLTIDLPVTAFTEDEAIGDIFLMVDFVDANYAELMPPAEEE